jgi:arylsulfatase A
VTDALFAQIDLMATFSNYLGFELPDKSAEDSHDFFPYLKGDTKNPPRTAMVHNTRQNEYAIRDGDWLLVDAKSGANRQPSAQWFEKHKVPAYNGQAAGLYNLREDIGQRNNLAEQQPDKVKELQALLGKIRDQGYSAPRLAK